MEANLEQFTDQEHAAPEKAAGAPAASGAVVQHDDSPQKPGDGQEHGNDSAAAADPLAAANDHDVAAAHDDAASHDAHAAATYDIKDSLGVKLQKGQAYFLEQNHLLEHVQDADHFALPKFLGGKWHLPSVTGDPVGQPLIAVSGYPVIKGQLTKFMVLEVIAAVIIFVAFKWLANRVVSGGKPVGRCWNFLESMVVFVRDEVALPGVGSHDLKRFLPFLLTTFFFILVVNLLGMIPWMGSATGAISVTAVLAVSTILVVLGTGMKKMGVVGFWKAQLPHMDLPPAMAIVMKPGIWLIEVFGFFVKHLVLALRLFANMVAGHLVLAVLIAFIGVVSATWLVWLIAPLAVAVSVALGVLELFVACLQAFVFTLLAALFIGAAQHAH